MRSYNLKDRGQKKHVFQFQNNDLKKIEILGFQKYVDIFSSSISSGKYILISEFMIKRSLLIVYIDNNTSKQIPVGFILSLIIYKITL